MTAHRIDTHHHPYPPVYLSAVGERLRLTTHAFYPKLLTWRPEAAIEAMDRAGIATAVLSISAPGVWFGDAQEARALARDCNDACARIQADHRGRFGHFAALPLPDTDASLREIEHAFDVLGADGIALMTNYDDKWPGDGAFQAVFDELDRRKAVVYFHPTAASFLARVLADVPPPIVEFPFDTTRAITSLLFGGVFARCPDIRWIFSHGGGALPMVAHRLAGFAQNRPDLAPRMPQGVRQMLARLYLDVVGVCSPGAFKAVLDVVPMRNLLFGTDVPFWAPEGTIDGLAGLKLDAADLAAIERDNALALLPRLAQR